MTLEKLANSIDVKENIVSMERIGRRIVENGEMKTVYGSNILVIFEGKNLP